MHKFPLQIAHDIRPNRIRSKLVRAAAIFTLGLSVAPLIAEGFSISYAQWCEVLGKNSRAETPILDSVEETVVTTNRALWSHLDPQFQRLPWNPTVTLAAAVVLMSLAMLMLRR